MIFDCIVLGRKTESVPTNRIKNIVTLKSAFSCNCIKCCVRTRMTYMKALSRRIRKLDKSIKLFFFCVITAWNTPLSSRFLSILFYGFMIVFQSNPPAINQRYLSGQRFRRPAKVFQGHKNHGLIIKHIDNNINVVKKNP